MDQKRIKEAINNIFVEPMDFKAKVKHGLDIKMQRTNKTHKSIYRFRFATLLTSILFIAVLTFCLIMGGSKNIDKNENKNTPIINPEDDVIITEPVIKVDDVKIIVVPESSPSEAQVDTDSQTKVLPNTLLNQTLLSQLKYLYQPTNTNQLISLTNDYILINQLIAMTEGKTKQELCTLVNDNNQILTLNNLYNNNKNIISRNSLWISGDYEFNYQTVNPLAVNYRLSIMTTNFENVASLNKINQWITNSSNQNIKLDQIGNSNINITNNTNIKLLSSLLYEDLWSSPLKKIKNDFITDKNTITTNFLVYEGLSSYNENDQYLVSSITTKNKTKILFVLPSITNSIDNIIKNENTLLKIINDYNKYNEKVRITFPPFTISSSVDKNSTLKARGVQTLFTDIADFNPLIQNFNSKNIQITEFLYLSINNLGFNQQTEEVATFVDNDTSIKTFNYNRPFITIIMNNDCPLFVVTINEINK